MKPNTSYGLRIPADEEIITAFGSLMACLRVTGGDLPTILFYLNNPERIQAAAEVAAQAGGYSESFRERALAEAAGTEWDKAEAGGSKPTIIGVARAIGVCRQVARRALENSRRLAV